jgi:hypothetical protein
MGDGRCRPWYRRKNASGRSERHSMRACDAISPAWLGAALPDSERGPTGVSRRGESKEAMGGVCPWVLLAPPLRLCTSDHAPAERRAVVAQVRPEHRAGPALRTAPPRSGLPHFGGVGVRNARRGSAGSSPACFLRLGGEFYPPIESAWCRSTLPSPSPRDDFNGPLALIGPRSLSEACGRRC